MSGDGGGWNGLAVISSLEMIVVFGRFRLTRLSHGVVANTGAAAAKVTNDNTIKINFVIIFPFITAILGLKILPKSAYLESITYRHAIEEKH
jgi:hypothetical protein